MIGLGASLALHLSDRHFARPGKQLRQMALVTRIEVLNQHERQAGIVRQMAEQLRECLQSTGRGSHANNGGWAGFGASLVGWQHNSLRGNGTRGFRGGIPCRGYSPLWAGRVRRTRRTRGPPSYPTTAGLLCHPHSYLSRWNEQALSPGSETRPILHAPCHSRARLPSPLRASQLTEL